MAWELKEALEYYGCQGAPSDQPALVNLLKEIQAEAGLNPATVAEVARSYGVKESLILAIIKRYPSLHLENTHCLELCSGVNCSRRAQLASFVEKTYGKQPKDFELRYVNCMRMCGKGPNIRWDGTTYNGADEKLIRSLVEKL